MKKLIMMIGLCGVLAACSEETKKDLGLVKEAPDEFAVVTRAPLSVPPEYSLRPPKPGAGRPMEISTKEQARQTVFGVKDVDSQSGVAKAEAEESVGFLNKIGVSKADPNIRQTLDSDRAVDNRTTAERLLFLEGSGNEGDPIDPNAEYDRLKEEGVVAVKKRDED